MSDRYLPEELWPGILCMLPVKSLLRFRCVSRSWRSLIDDRDFARLHLKSFKKNVDEASLFFIQRWDKETEHWVVRSSDTWETDEAAFDSNPGHNSCGVRWQAVSCIDGLVLLKSCESFVLKNRKIKLWNPSMRKSHDFHLYSPETAASLEGFSVEIEIGIGYDPLLEDYKHVRLALKECPFEGCFVIYTLGTDSWEIIDLQGEIPWHWLPSCVDMKVCLQGILYFIARDLNKRAPSWELLSIDLKTNAFASTGLPEFPHFRSRNFEGDLTVVDGGGSLAVFGFESSNSSSLWVLESESMHWSRRHLFSLRVPEILYLRKSGDILLWRCVEEEKPYRGGSFDKEVEHQWVSYSPQTNEEKILLQKKCCSVAIRGVFAYVESLILPK